MEYSAQNRPHMSPSPSWSQFGALAIVAVLCFFINLGGPRLYDEDEPKNAECGREMFVRGDWIVPTFNDDLRTDKPILIYWFMLASYHLFGVSEFGARFFSATLSVGTTLLTYRLGSRLFSPRVGWLAGLALCTSLMFAAVGRSATPDAMLIVCVTGAITLYVELTARRHGGRFGGIDLGPANRLPWREFLPATFAARMAVFAVMGLAMLAKGPVGFVLPTAIIGMFLLCRQEIDAMDAASSANSSTPTSNPLTMAGRLRSVLSSIVSTFWPGRLLSACWEMGVLPGLGVACVIALPWYAAVGWKTEGAWLAGFLGGHNVGRFLSPMENHSGPIVYYIPVLMLGVFPWSVWLPAAVRRVSQSLWRRESGASALLFVACWIGVWVGFFSLAKTKLPNYVLPAYPALALLVAWFVDAIRREAFDWSHFWMKWGCRSLAIASAVVSVAVGVALSMLLPDAAALAVLPLAGVAGGMLAEREAAKRRLESAVAVFGMTAVAFVTLLFGIASTPISRLQDGPVLAALSQELVGSGTTSSARPLVGTYEYFAPNLVFYLQRRVEPLRAESEIAAFFDRTDGVPLLITRGDKLDAMRSALPPGVVELARRPRFLRKHDLVVLGRGPLDVAQQPAPAPSR